MRYISEVYWDRGGKCVNQDSISLQEVSIGGKAVLLALICDGIGGLWGGEAASGFVAEKITEWFYKEALLMLYKRKKPGKIEKAGLRILFQCNEELGRFAHRMDRKIGTTATIVLCYGKRYFLWHTGDTRVYRISNRVIRGRRGKIKIRQLTEDHTLYEHALTRCVGCFPWAQPDVSSGKLGKGETILLCSDGFRNQIGEKKLGEAMQSGTVQSEDDLGMRLCEIAKYVKRKGEEDNISAIAVRIR